MCVHCLPGERMVPGCTMGRLSIPQFDALGNDLLGNFGPCHSCGCYFDEYHLPKHWCWPCAPFHGKGSQSTCKTSSASSEHSAPTGPFYQLRGVEWPGEVITDVDTQISEAAHPTSSSRMYRGRWSLLFFLMSTIISFVLSLLRLLSPTMTSDWPPPSCRLLHSHQWCILSLRCCPQTLGWGWLCGSDTVVGEQGVRQWFSNCGGMRGRVGHKGLFPLDTLLFKIKHCVLTPGHKSQKRDKHKLFCWSFGR